MKKGLIAVAVVVAVTLTAIINVGGTAFAASCPTTCGSYTVSGLGSRKQQILKTERKALS
jgi:hypothetical protein